MNEIVKWYLKQAIEEAFDKSQTSKLARKNLMDVYEIHDYSNVSKDTLLRALELAVRDVG